ncbi:MAG: glycosyl transferase [Smithella sp. SDB]|nr:MAG: glycosyl transferase [Smithella sp. SDB]
MKVAIIGSQGVPAQYGGFETLVENIIGENCSPDIQYTVFCSAKDFADKLQTYKGAGLKYIPFRANGIQSTPYDILSLAKAIKGYDAVLLLGASGCIALPLFKLFSRSKLIINIDGLEHKRGKWSRFAKSFLRLSESFAVKYADILIIDNKGIQDYVSKTYNKDSELIAYGGDHALRDITDTKQQNVIEQYSLIPDAYSLKISRIEPENNCKIILDAFVKTGECLVYIGNWSLNDFSKKLQSQYAEYSNIRLIDSLYDLDTLYALRRHCKFYVHGHSAGGTNPSLVEAMFFGCPVFAFDVVFNKETTEYKANYFQSESELCKLITTHKSIFKENGLAMTEIANRRYTWAKIAKEYEGLYFKINHQKTY